MTKWMLAAALLALLISCKRKKKEPRGQMFPVSTFLKTEVKRLDSGAYRFTRITSGGDGRDTAAITVQEAKALAAEFSGLEDISQGKKAERYDIANRVDSVLKSLVLTYTTRNEEESIRRETVLMEPDSAGLPKVSTLIVDKVLDSPDSTVEKNMVWYVNRRYLIVSKVFRNGQLVRTNYLTVKWE